MGNKVVGKQSEFIKIILVVVFSIVCFSNQTIASPQSEDDKKEEGFQPNKVILHHIQDAHEWHFGPLTIPLPVILYSDVKGLQLFLSSSFHNEQHAYRGYKLSHGKVKPLNESETVYDFSITKNVASMLLSVIILLAIFITVAKKLKKNIHGAPRGIQSLMEPLIIFVRDEIAYNNIGPKYYKYFPFIITLFFFIWVNNMLGLIPGGANTSGNIAFTMTLAVFSGLVINVSGTKEYWKHIINPPGVPFWLLPIMIPIEIISVITKPFALMVRLFANITAGHIVILSIISFIFIFESIYVSGVSVPLAVFMYILEFFVAALQAYIFALLSALFIGLAIEEHH